METLRATRPIRLARIVLVPIQRIHVERLGHRAVHASCTPHAVVVGEEGRWRALGPGGDELELQPLLEEVRGLAETLGDRRATPSGPEDPAPR